MIVPVADAFMDELFGHRGCEFMAMLESEHVQHHIEGGRAAQMLRELVADAGNGADVIAELGLGFNPTVTPRGHVMLDEKAAGTAHVAIGRNTGGYGGVNEASIHVDCIFSGPRVEVDGRPLDLQALDPHAERA